MGSAKLQTSSLYPEGHTVESIGTIPFFRWRLEKGLCVAESREIIHVMLSSKKSRSIPKIFARQYEVRINLFT